jgi:hypothetical protein
LVVVMFVSGRRERGRSAKATIVGRAGVAATRVLADPWPDLEGPRWIG